MPSAIFLFALMMSPLAVQQAQDGIITGRILDMNGEPAAGMRVAAVRESENTGPGGPRLTTESVSWTDASGFYRLESVPPGRYHIRMGQASLPLFLVTIAGVPDPDLVVVSPGLKVDLPLVAPPEFEVQGRLTGDSLSAYKAVHLSGTTWYIAQVHRDGSFRFSGIPSGRFQLSVGTDIREIRSMPVKVESRDVENIEIPVPGLEEVNVRLEVEDGVPLPHVVLSLKGDLGQYNTLTESPFVRTSRVVVPRGSYSAVLIDLPPSYSIRSIRSGGTNLLTDSLLVDSASEVVVTLGPSSPDDWVTVGGRVSPPTGVGGRSGSVVLVGQGLWAETPIQSDGSFEFAKVLRGSYGIRVYPGRTTQSGRIDVQEDTRALEIERPETVEVRGRFVVEGGLPLPPVSLRFDGGQGATIATIEGDGTFLMPLTEGRYTLIVEPVASFRVRSASSGLADLLAVPLDVNAAAPPEIEIVLEPNQKPPVMRTVRGRVVGVSNLPVPRPPVWLESQDVVSAPPRQTTIRNDGSFEFNNVYPGRYYARGAFNIVMDTSENANVTVVDEDSEDVRLIVPPQIRVRGRVVVENGRPLPSIGMVIGSLSTMPLSPEGSFEVTLPPGRHPLILTRIPEGYDFPSITYGSSDLANAPLILTGPSPEEIRIVFGE